MVQPGQCSLRTCYLTLVQETAKKKGGKGGKGDDEAHGILEGISSLHSWIKTQTMIRPTKLGKKKDDMSFDDVSTCYGFKSSQNISVTTLNIRMMMRTSSSPSALRTRRLARVWSGLTTPTESLSQSSLRENRQFTEPSQ